MIGFSTESVQAVAQLEVVVSALIPERDLAAARLAIPDGWRTYQVVGFASTRGLLFSMLWRRLEGLRRCTALLLVAIPLLLRQGFSPTTFVFGG
jgi:hypothetical protein